MWIAGTLIFNMPGDQNKLQRSFKRVGLSLPTWKFFAPTPATTDLIIMYRDLSRARDDATEWKAVDIHRDRGSDIVWPPPGRDRKAYVDLAQELRTVCTELDNAVPAIREMPIYALTVHYLRNLSPLSHTSEIREFMIVEAHSSIDTPSAVPIFISDSFELTPRAATTPNRFETRPVSE
ncbi:hypothetical protein [Gordonia effusa]|uniref:hypothetical protein n=1 Tax=Gordonia effusa TaxID=263908 RepID=UPI001FE161DC|nr:hypothetical protein [Gordonia effusa]